VFGAFKRLLSPRARSTEPATGNALVTTAASSRYLIANVDGELRQGEIISGLQHYLVQIDPADLQTVKTSGIIVPYAVVATQDCDLLHSFHALQQRALERINGILFFEAEEAIAFKTRMKYSSKEMKRIRQCQWDGYHMLIKFDPDVDHLGKGIPELVVDFKRYFMIPTAEVYRQCRASDAYRRCFLGDLYREDLQQRAMNFMARVGLPEE
jgi:hypothetical protein